MKILVAGNSQAGALHLALTGGLITTTDGVEIDFYVVPGGTGPTFAIDDGKLKVTAFNEKFPPRMDPPDTAAKPITGYDAILVSALGYVDGGFAYQNPIVSQGLVAEFGPKQDAPLVSQSCLEDVVSHGLFIQAGFVFLRNLCRDYSGRIIVQPFPNLSELLLSREDWTIRKSYEDHAGFSRFLSAARDRALRKWCDAWGAELLDHPDPAFVAAGFTPRHLMRDSDGLHPQPEYGAMVLRQLLKRCGISTDPP